MEYLTLPYVIQSVSVGIKAKPHFATLDCHVATSFGLWNIQYSATAHKVCNFIVTQVTISHEQSEYLTVAKATISLQRKRNLFAVALHHAHNFHVARLRKHIEGRNPFDVVTLRENLQISCKRLRIATDVDDFFDFRFYRAI